MSLKTSQIDNDNDNKTELLPAGTHHPDNDDNDDNGNGKVTITSILRRLCGFQCVVYYKRFKISANRFLDFQNRTLFEKVRRILVISFLFVSMPFTLLFITLAALSFFVNDVNRQISFYTNLSALVGYFVIFWLAVMFPKREVGLLWIGIVIAFFQIDFVVLTNKGGMLDGGSLAITSFLLFICIFVAHQNWVRFLWVGVFTLNVVVILLLDIFTTDVEILYNDLKNDYTLKIISAYVSTFFPAYISVITFLYKTKVREDHDQKVINKQKVVIDKIKPIQNDLDMIISEKRLESDKAIPFLRINRELFQIDDREIKLINLIGRGGSDSKVYKADWKGNTIAYKLFKTSDFQSEKSFEAFEKEASIMASINHPNIIEFFGCSINPPRIGIVLSFCEKGDLKEFIETRIKEDKRLNFEERLRLSIEIASGLEFLHSRLIIHRDLKSLNILITASEKVKITDFGLSRFMSNMNTMKTTQIGTTVYMAPEITLAQDYTSKVDVFSYGIVIYEILTDNFEPYGDFEGSIPLNVANSPTFRPKIDKKDFEGNEWFVELMKMCWSHFPKDRPNISQICYGLKNKTSELIDIQPSLIKLKMKKTSKKNKVVVSLKESDHPEKGKKKGKLRHHSSSGIAFFIPTRKKKRKNTFKRRKSKGIVEKSDSLVLNTISLKKINDENQIEIDEIKNDDSIGYELQILNDLYRVKVQDVELLKFIASGGQGSIYLCKVKQWKDLKLVIKYFRVKKLTKDVSLEIEREIKVYLKCKHPNILKIYAVCFQKNYVGLLLEFCKYGNLKKFINNNPDLSKSDKIRLLWQGASALQYLHLKGIIHRDLKPENILVSSSINAKVSDFGLARDNNASLSMTKQVGTSFYMAPEVMATGGTYDKRCDIYSYAIILYQVLSNNFHPFGDIPRKNYASFMKKILNDPNYRPLMDEFKENHDEWMASLIEKCWDSIPSNRLSFTEICEVFRDNVDESSSISAEKKRSVVIYIKTKDMSSEDAEDVELLDLTIDELQKSIYVCFKGITIKTLTREEDGKEIINNDDVNNLKDDDVIVLDHV